MPASQTQTATAIPTEPGVDNFAVSSTSGVGGDEKNNDFAGATGGTDAFSETPNARTLDEVEQDGTQSKLGELRRLLLGAGPFVLLLLLRFALR